MTKAGMVELIVSLSTDIKATSTCSQATTTVRTSRPLDAWTTARHRRVQKFTLMTDKLILYVVVWRPWAHSAVCAVLPTDTTTRNPASSEVSLMFVP